MKTDQLSDPYEVLDERFSRCAGDSRLERLCDDARYDPTNEPGIHAPWLYNALGQPWKTQKTVRVLAAQAYSTRPRGLPGNDDLPTMSAWYVSSALGLYPQSPSRAELLLSSPIFPEARVRRRGRAVITVRAPRASPENVYVRRVRVDGRPQTRSWLPASVVTGGGDVRVDLAATPQPSFGTGPGDLPIDYVR